MILSFAHQELHLTADGMIWLPEPRLLAAADIHFEKASFFSRFATLLPPYDTADTLQRLEKAIAHYAPRHFYALGDSFHDARAGERMRSEDSERLNALIARVPEWVWITGNHDPAIDARLAGERRDEARLGKIIFRHCSKKEESGFEISGHYHPKVSVVIRKHRISGPCFVRHHEKLVLPSFGTYTGGLDVAGAAFKKSFPGTARYYLLKQERVIELGI